MSGLQLDAHGVETVRASLDHARGKSHAEQVAFNEGCMAAAFAMGAVIDGLDANDPMRSVLERAFNLATKARIKIALPPPLKEEEAA